MDSPWPDNCAPERVLAKSDMPTPQIAKTSLDDLWNPVNGKRYTCSRAFERAVKAKGCEIIGNDSSLTNPKPKPIATPNGLGDDIKRAWDSLT